MLQPVLQSLLLLRSKPPELRITLQGLLLVSEGELAMTLQPVAAVALAGGRRSRNVPRKRIRLRRARRLLRGLSRRFRYLPRLAIDRRRRRMRNRTLLLLSETGRIA